MQPAFAEAGIDLKTGLSASEDIMLQADGQRLSQLFMNLLKNSLHYTSSPGELIVNSEIKNGKLLLNFMDSGPGVPKDSLPHLFDRLYRVEHSRNRASGGTGLGLAISRNIVLAHDGQIEALAAPPGGLWIRITLPISGTI